MKHCLRISTLCTIALCSAGCSDSGTLLINIPDNSCNNIQGNIRNDYFHPASSDEISEEIIQSGECPQDFPYCMTIDNEDFCSKCSKGQIYAKGKCFDFDSDALLEDGESCISYEFCKSAQCKDGHCGSGTQPPVTNQCPECDKDQHCSEETHWECIQNTCPECPAGQHCNDDTEWKCIPDECPVCQPDQYCDDSTNGECVPKTCPACPQNQHCSSETNWICVPDTPVCPACPQNQHCSSETNWICVPDTPVCPTCPQNQHCSSETNWVCVPDTPVCQINTHRCNANILETCSDGYSFTTVQNCAQTPDTPVCIETGSSASCGCQPQTTYCQGNTVMTCGSDGIFTVSEICDETTQKCQTTNGSASCVVNRVLKVLIIDIDPVLTKGTVEGRSCKGITASECLGQNKQQAIDELIEDIEFSSHNTVKVEIVGTEITNAFSVHKSSTKLSSGKSAHQYDETTWLNVMKDGWYSAIFSNHWNDFEDYSFDYDHYIDKYNLLSRRNSGEFNEVWLVNVDISKTFESVLVGRNAYWINGTAQPKDSELFRMMNVSISRPDVNFECFGHATENLMNNVFSKTMGNNYNPLQWNSQSTTITSSNYAKLNLWQRFMLTEWENTSKKTGFTGVGNMHYSPNSTEDYQWRNTSALSVPSKWQEWENYPDMTNKASTKNFNPTTAYLNAPITGTASDARLHHRWWFGLFPHIDGYTSDGYSNNWWDYFVSGEYVTALRANPSSYTFSVGEQIQNITIEATLVSSKVQKITLNRYQQNMTFSNPSLFDINSNQITAVASGTSTLTYYRDGISTSVTIKIQ